MAALRSTIMKFCSLQAQIILDFIVKEKKTRRISHTHDSIETQDAGQSKDNLRFENQNNGAIFFSFLNAA